MTHSGRLSEAYLTKLAAIRQDAINGAYRDTRVSTRPSLGFGGVAPIAGDDQRSALNRAGLAGFWQEASSLLGNTNDARYLAAIS